MSLACKSLLIHAVVILVYSGNDRDDHDAKKILLL
jgi:hypothetical protein